MAVANLPQDPALWPHTTLMDEFHRRVHEAFDDIGCLKNGRFDGHAIDEKAFPYIRASLAGSKSERPSAALLKPVLARNFFPSLVQLGEQGWESMDMLERMVSHEQTRKVWDAIKVGPNSRIQKWLTPEGLVLCKCVVSPDGKGAVPACYVTDDIELLQLDYMSGYQDRTRSAGATLAAAAGEAIKALPQHKKELEDSVTTTLDAVGTLARDMLAIEAPKG